MTPTFYLPGERAAYQKMCRHFVKQLLDRKNTQLRAENTARDRAEQLLYFLFAVNAGFSKTEAAKLVGLNYVTAWRRLKALMNHGWPGLKPETWRCGRKRK